MSRKGGTGGGGWIHPLDESSMTMSGLGCRKDYKTVPLLVRPPFLAMKLFSLSGHTHSLMSIQ